MFDAISYVIPAYAMAAIFNGDYSGLTDAESDAITDFENSVIAEHGPGHWAMPEEMNFPDFRRDNDIDSLAGDCYDVDFMARRDS